MDPELKYDDQYYANERAKIMAELAKNPVSYTGMGGIEGSLAPDLPRLPESNYVSADEIMHVNKQLRECDDLVTSINRAYDKNDKKKFLDSLYEKLNSITPLDSTQEHQLKGYWFKYNYKKGTIDAMPGGSRRRNKKSKKSKSRKTKYRKTKSRKTKSRRH